MWRVYTDREYMKKLTRNILIQFAVFLNVYFFIVNKRSMTVYQVLQFDIFRIKYRKHTMT